MGYRLMAVFAHPDDESCGPGGTLALHAGRGVDVTLVCATRGELGGEPAPDKHLDPKLGALREQELRAACRALGLARCIVLDFPDGRLHKHLSALERRTVQLIRTFRPQVVLTLDPESTAGGRDHQTVGRAVVKAFWGASDLACCEDAGCCELDRYGPQRLFCWLVRPCCGEPVLPPNAQVVTMDVSAFLEQRKAALSCHRSQAACCGRHIARLAEPEEAFERFRLGASMSVVPSMLDEDLFAGLDEVD